MRTPIKSRARLFAVALSIMATLCALESCAVFGKPRADPLAWRREALARESGALESAVSDQQTPTIRDYLRFADSLEPDYTFRGERRFGTIQTPKFRLGCILLLPPADAAGGRPEPRGTLVAFHGYLSYSVYNLSALYRLADKGWVVVAVDLPGHGYSTGRPGDIQNFSDYAQAIGSVLSWVRSQTAIAMPRPHILLGHSGGGAAVLETLWRSPEAADAAILLAPLMRPRSFRAARAAAYLFAPFIRDLPPRDAEEDYLGVPRVPLSWMRSLARWESTLINKPMLRMPLLVIQGDKDEVLSWKYNMELLAKLAPGARIQILPGASHILLDRGDTQGRCLELINHFFDDERLGASEPR